MAGEMTKGEPVSDQHDGHCFVAVPYGKDDAEHSVLQAWVDEIVVPVVKDLDLTPEVAALRTAPNAITLEIRTHLALDRLAIFDLASAQSTDAPNPNVMYELGIRHAFDLPAIVLASEDQILPFDIAEHRVIRKNRTFATMQWYRNTLKEFAAAALNGDFFRPMMQVRTSRILAEAVDQSESGVLKAIREELHNLRGSLDSLREQNLYEAVYQRHAVEAGVGLRSIGDLLSSQLTGAADTPLPLRTAAKDVRVPMAPSSEIPGTRSER
jgi:hypothetical protein